MQQHVQLSVSYVCAFVVENGPAQLQNTLSSANISTSSLLCIQAHAVRGCSDVAAINAQRNKQLE